MNRVFPIFLWLSLLGIACVPFWLVLSAETPEGSPIPESLIAPMVCGVLLALGVVIEILRKRRAKGEAKDEENLLSTFIQSLLIIALAFLSVFIVEYFGFFVSTLFLLIGGAALLKETRVSRYILVSLLWAALVYLLFSYTLMVPLPEGSFFT